MSKSYFLPVIQDSLSLIVGEYPDKGYVRAPLCESLAEAQQMMYMQRQSAYPRELRYSDGRGSEKIPNVEMIYEIKLPDGTAAHLDATRYSTRPLQPVETPIDLGAVRIMNVYSTIQHDALHGPKSFEEQCLADQRPEHAALTYQLMKQVAAVYDMMRHVANQHGHRAQPSMRDQRLFDQLKASHAAGLYTLYSDDALIRQDPHTLSTQDRALQLLEQQMYENCHPGTYVYAINLPLIFKDQIEQIQNELGPNRVPHVDDIMKAASNTANIMNSALGFPDSLTAGLGMRYALLHNDYEQKWPTDPVHTCAAVSSFQRYAQHIPEDVLLQALWTYTDMAKKAEMQLGKDGCIRQTLYGIANSTNRPDIAEQLHGLLNGELQEKPEQEQEEVID